MIHVLNTRFDTDVQPDNWQKELCYFPEAFQTKVLKYIRWQDQLRALYGRLLLLKGLSVLKQHDLSLEAITEDSNGRPMLSGSGIDFNISHSGGCVVCALTSNGQVGIDVEEIRPFQLEGVKLYFTPDEQRALSQATDPVAMFYELWTKKESVLKANGRGLSISLDSVVVTSSKTQCLGQIYSLKKLNIMPGYCCHLASTEQVEDIQLKTFNSKDLKTTLETCR